MKFGKELDRRSVLKWRHNNIHYNDLKYKIKLATSISSRNSVSSSESSSNTNSNVSKQRSSLKELYKSFGKEIEFITLFVNTEYEKNLYYLIQLRSKLEKFLSNYNNDGNVNNNNNNNNYNSDNNDYKNDINIILKSKTFIRYCNEANILLDNLNDLSQFINLQKLLLRKLFKKFIKYSSLSNKLEFIQHIKDKFLDGNPQSFVNVDLNPVIQELSLIIDVLNSINENRRVDFPTTKLMDKTFTRDLKFDIISITKGIFRNEYLVHYDNLNELKIRLLKDFDLICNDDGKTNLNYLKKTTSSLSLQRNKSFSSVSTAATATASATPNGTISKLTSKNDQSASYFQPDNEVNSLILGPPTLDKIHSSITAIGNGDNLLLAKVGGFKNIAYTKLSDKMMSTLLDSSLDRDEKICRVRKLVNPSNDVRVLEWALSSPMEPIYQLKLTRTRFISKAKSSTKQNFYITLDSNIETDAPYSQFPYCIFSISYESLITFPPNIDSLVNSHLLYHMPLDFSLVNFLNLKFYLTDIEKPQWFYDIQSAKDIKKMPPQTIRSHNELPRSILLNKNESRSGPSASPNTKNLQKYWNEFDNGSDYETNDDDAFYISASSSTPVDQQILSSSNVNNILKFTNKIVNFFQYIFGNSEKSSSKLFHKQSSYGSFDSDTENDEDDEETSAVNRELMLARTHSPSFNSISKNRNNRIFLEQLQYDKVLTVIYFFILFSSVILNGISIGILYTLLANSLTNASVLLIFIFVCFFFGLILSITGICLVNSRYHEPPAWHYLTTYLVLILNIFVICLGIKLTSPYLV